MHDYPAISVGDLKRELALYPDDYLVDFCGLEFYRVKQRGEKSVQVEFNQAVYRTADGRVVVADPD